MGRCGRSRNKEIENDISILDSFHLIISLPSLTYLLERIFVDCTLSTDELAFRESVISVNDSNKMQVDNILEVVSFIFNSTQCWHLTIEELCANDELENSLDTTIHQPCNHMCPWCNKALDVFIKPINKRGLIQFLVHVFIENNYSNITPMMLCTQLKTYASVGSAIYGRRVDTAPAIVFINSTILQLIGSKILKVEVCTITETNLPSTILRLNYIFDNDNEFGQLAYNIDTYWSGFKFID